ncbi:MAG TPA: histidine phosphatase family protein [Lachnospiraceae bacterium]|nr:histidine phosphatase family protein [Lachnospiraceae bacterium]
MTEFMFVRHGEPDYKRFENWCQNTQAKDFAPLSDKGIQQIHETATILRDEHAQLILSSPYTRALESAIILSKVLGLDIVIEPDLHEWQLDMKQNCKNKLILKLLLLANSKKVYIPFISKRIESKQHVEDRVLNVLRKYTSYSKVIICGHACMMGYVTDEFRQYEYGEIKRMLLNKKEKDEPNSINKKRSSLSKPNTLDQISFVCIMTRYHDKWVACWHKKRNGWEFPAGHVEQGETALEAAQRELYEETGAKAYRMIPLWDYHFIWENGTGWNNGRYYFADVTEFHSLPESEMSKIDFFDEIPENYTYGRDSVVSNSKRTLDIVQNTKQDQFVSYIYTP